MPWADKGEMSAAALVGSQVHVGNRRHGSMVPSSQLARCVTAFPTALPLPARVPRCVTARGPPSRHGDAVPDLRWRALLLS